MTLENKLTKIYQLQKQAFEIAPYPTLRERKSALFALRVQILKHKDDIIQAISQDFGYRSANETMLAEIFQVIKTIDYVLKNAKKWLKKEKRKRSFIFWPAKNYVFYQPLGVIGIMVPWNYPFLLAISPMIYALIAGNRVMIKSSEYTPCTSKLITKITQSIYPLSKVAVLNGDAQFARDFSALPFNHLLFTGSTEVGKKVMREAANNLTPVTLELGGKSPLVIDQGYPISKLAKTIVFNKCLNAGQTCIAPDYLMVHESQLEELVNKLISAFQLMYQEGEKTVTSLLSPRYFNDLCEELLLLKKKNIQVYSGESFSRASEVKRLPLTLVVNPPEDSMFMQREIFAPILPIISYQNQADVLAKIKSYPAPLALYLYSNNYEVQQYFLMNAQSGGMCINDVMVHIAQNDLPFGGIGSSGMGRYHAKEGFKCFSNAKSVCQRGRVNPAKMLYPPYGKLYRLFSALFIR
ncbi:aldehyde dehydrogenase family protein [Fangia hongkongensis]|uniref:aldehyde dehydrogenase family protein n=1 Tax=Fangia hongkongensis TaxID=270495 RepID=UPI0003828F90|nr:aldehyde dehydrogenase family protein [Fangia hongkongensis]MBK2124325.1 aldehyde dehydrogenase family protein [Fangia hongkongensis]